MHCARQVRGRLSGARQLCRHHLPCRSGFHGSKRASPTRYRHFPGVRFRVCESVDARVDLRSPITGRLTLAIGRPKNPKVHRRQFGAAERHGHPGQGPSTVNDRPAHVRRRSARSVPARHRRSSSFSTDEGATRSARSVTSRFGVPAGKPRRATSRPCGSSSKRSSWHTRFVLVPSRRRVPGTVNRLQKFALV